MGKTCISISELAESSIPLNSQIVISLFSVSQIPFLKKLLRMYNPKTFNVLVLALEFEVYEELLENNIDSKLISHYSNRSNFLNIDDMSIELARNWYIDTNKNDITEFEGVSLGSVIIWEFSYFFAESIKCLEEVKTFLDREHPDIIISLAMPTSVSDSIILNNKEDFHTDAFHAIGSDISIKTIKVWDKPSAGYIFKDLSSLKQFLRNNITHPLYHWSRIIYASKLVPVIEKFYGLSFSSNKTIRNNILVVGINHIGWHLLDTIFNGRTNSRVTLTGRGGILKHPRYQNSVTSLYISARQKFRKNKKNKSIKSIFIEKHETYHRSIIDNLNESVSNLGSLKCVQERIRAVFTNKFVNLAIEKQTLENILRKKNISLVITPGDVREFERLLVSVGNHINIKSLVIQHGAAGHKIGFSPMISSKIAVYDQTAKTQLESYGTPSCRIAVTGPMSFKDDKFNTKVQIGTSTNSNRLLETLQIKPSDKVILLATQHAERETKFVNVHWSHEQWRKVCSDIVTEIYKQDDLHLIIKIHPGSSDKHIWRRWLVKNHLTSKVSLLKNYPIKDLIDISKIVITGFSTVGIETLASGVPLITVNYTGRPDRMPYAESGAAIGVYNPSQIGPAIQKSLFDQEFIEAQRQAGYKFIGRNLEDKAGSSHEQISKLIDSLLTIN